MFKAAKAAALRRNDEPEPEARKRRGEQEGGGPVTLRLAPRAAGRPAARGKYRALRTTAQNFARGGHGAGLYLADTLDWLTLWQDNANCEPWNDNDFSAKQDHYSPQP